MRVRGNRRSLPIIWCHRQPSAAVLDLITQAAKGVGRVLICPDADLCGVRIAARIAGNLQTAARELGATADPEARAP